MTAEEFRIEVLPTIGDCWKPLEKRLDRPAVQAAWFGLLRRVSAKAANAALTLCLQQAKDSRPPSPQTVVSVAYGLHHDQPARFPLPDQEREWLDLVRQVGEGGVNCCVNRQDGGAFEVDERCVNSRHGRPISVVAYDLTRQRRGCRPGAIIVSQWHWREFEWLFKPREGGIAGVKPDPYVEAEKEVRRKAKEGQAKPKATADDPTPLGDLLEKPGEPVGVSTDRGERTEPLPPPAGSPPPGTCDR